jgi:hypothetical protein
LSKDEHHYHATTIADISNLGGQQGRITWHSRAEGGLKPVNFTATLGGKPANPRAPCCCAVVDLRDRVELSYGAEQPSG